MMFVFNVFVLVMLVVRCLGELEGPNVCRRIVRVNSSSPAIAKPYVINMCRDDMPNCSETRKDEEPAIKMQHQIRSHAIKECCSGYVENETKTGCVPVCSSTPCPIETEWKSCPNGFWGNECENQCNCSGNINCDQFDGKCVSRTTTCLFGEWDDRLNKCNCQAGHYGEKCNKQCPRGTYGYDCLSNCTCQNNATCNSTNGECSCTEGWTGTNCTDPCSTGTWGPACVRRCDCNNDGTCDHVNGTCICTDEFIGPHCGQPCPPRTVAVNGQCRCKPGRTGLNCTQECYCGTKDENCNSETPCLASWINYQDHKEFWLILIGFVTSVSLIIAIFAAFRIISIPFCIVGETAPLQDCGESNVFQENPLYTVKSLEEDSYLLPHDYSEIQQDNRLNSVYEKLDTMPPDNKLQSHYLNPK